MTKLLDVIKKTRRSLLQLINGLDPQQFNLIPDGFNNNIILTIEQLETDIDKGFFRNYMYWTNRFDIKMTCINDVLAVS